MSLSHNASLQLAPLFERIVLAVIVLPLGYVSIFRTSPFTNEEVARIESMGTPVKMMENSVEKIKSVAWRVESPSAAANEDGDKKDASEKSCTDGTEMRNLNQFILRLDDSKVPQPLIVGWVCAIAELVGGIILLAGLFTRWFALLLFIASGLHIWLMTWPQLRAALPWDWRVETMHEFSTALTAVLLSLSLLLTGAGRFSLDRLLFAKHDAD
ncbi:MAG: DoxX family protein [Phycisphaerales bacterium]|nr:DoxX family protein [Phycisphaerales bacterium]